MRIPKLIRKRAVALFILIIGVPILALIIFYAILLVALSLSEGPLFVPQDCIGVRIDLAGVVRDTDNNLIAAAEINLTSFNSLDETIVSDNNGQFAIDDLFIFACHPLFIHVSARGFDNAVMTYELMDQYTEDQISHTNRVEVEIIMERPR